MQNEYANAFRRISRQMVSILGDSCKPDLITIGYAIGISELSEDYPELFRNEDSEPEALDNQEIDQQDQMEVEVEPEEEVSPTDEELLGQ